MLRTVVRNAKGGGDGPNVPDTVFSGIFFSPKTRGRLVTFYFFADEKCNAIFIHKILQSISGAILPLFSNPCNS